MVTGGPNTTDTDWTADGGDRWSRTANGLTLHVYPDPENADAPWAWAVLILHGDWDEERRVDGAVNRDAAMAAAETAALSRQSRP